MPQDLKQTYHARATELETRDSVGSLPLDAQRKIGVLTERAQKKWDQLDTNGNG